MTAKTPVDPCPACGSTDPDERYCAGERPVTELLPCPFCGRSGPTIVGYWPDMSGLNMRVRCTCGVAVGGGIDEDADRERWNTRALTRQAQVSEPLGVVCPVCNAPAGKPCVTNERRSQRLDIPHSERQVSDDAVVERAVHKLIDAARMYEASCRLGGKDQEFASLKLDAAKSATIAVMAAPKPGEAK